MRLLLLAFALSFTTAPLSAQFKPLKPSCSIGPHYAKPGGGARAKPLGELPPGDLILTVFRPDENGCPMPLVVRQEIGSGKNRNIPSPGR